MVYRLNPFSDNLKCHRKLTLWTFFDSSIEALKVSSNWDNWSYFWEIKIKKPCIALIWCIEYIKKRREKSALKSLFKTFWNITNTLNILIKLTVNY